MHPPRALGPDEITVGNRFDSLTGRFGCLYLGTQSKGCMMEVLGRLKPDQQLAELVGGDWDARGWMRVANVPADWRDRRCRVQVAIDLNAAPFLDVDDAEPLQRLDTELRPHAWGVDQLDTSVIRGRDRRVTRLIADWAWAFHSEDEPFGFAGIRYVSRLDSTMECWAVFDDIEIREMARTPIAATDTDARYAAQKLGLTVH